jgi:hypothetical protein
VPLAPQAIEAIRRHFLDHGHRDGATLVSLLGYAGLRPEEALGLQWGHVRERTLLVEQAVSDGELKGQKTNRPARKVDLLAPLKQDLAEWRLASGRPADDAFLFPGTAADRPWREHDYRNWRRRQFRPAAEAAGLPQARPYDLRHSFASLLLHEGRVGVVDLAAQLGHSPTMTLDTYGHVIAELREAPPSSATEAIQAARAEDPRTPPKPRSATLRKQENRARTAEPTAGLEPATPSFRGSASTPATSGRFAGISSGPPRSTVSAVPHPFRIAFAAPKLSAGKTRAPPGGAPTDDRTQKTTSRRARVLQRPGSVMSCSTAVRSTLRICATVNHGTAPAHTRGTLANPFQRCRHPCSQGDDFRARL